MLVDSEWAGGSSRWAQSDTPFSSSTPSQSARWAQSDTPLAAPPQSDAWSAFRKSQSFLPARLQEHSPEGGLETDGNRAQRRSGPVSRSGAEQDAIEADAAELIKKVMLFVHSLAAGRCASVNTFCNEATSVCWQAPAYKDRGHILLTRMCSNRRARTTPKR
jgi:hypothetical protein